MTDRDQKNAYMSAKLNAFYAEHGGLNPVTIGDFQTMLMNDPTLCIIFNDYVSTAQMLNLPDNLDG